LLGYVKDGETRTVKASAAQRSDGEELPLRNPVVSRRWLLTGATSGTPG
jgi:hypothetical protein